MTDRPFSDPPRGHSYYAATVAHELGHCANIHHHREYDQHLVRWTVGTTPGGAPVVLEDQTKANDGKVQIVPVTTLRVPTLREYGTIVPPARFAEGQFAYVGTPGQRHSGVEDCLMRYDVATAYASRTQPLTRYWVDRSRTCH